MKWENINTEKPQEDIKYFFKIYYANSMEEKIVGYYYKERGKEFISEAFDGGTYRLEELAECYWLKEDEDWNLLEKQFNEDFNTLTDKPKTGYDVVQWFKKKLDGK